MAPPRLTTWSAHAALMRHVTEPEAEHRCWEVSVSLNKPGGYPTLAVPTLFRERWGANKTGKVYAYRLAYQIFVGPIPPYHEVDHLCSNHRCVNPDHLQAIPISDNRRGGAEKTNARRAQRRDQSLADDQLQRGQSLVRSHPANDGQAAASRGSETDGRLHDAIAAGSGLQPQGSAVALGARGESRLARIPLRQALRVGSRQADPPRAGQVLPVAGIP